MLNTADFDRWRQAFQEKLTTRKRQEKKRIFLKLTVAGAVLFLFLWGGDWPWSLTILAPSTFKTSDVASDDKFRTSPEAVVKRTVPRFGSCAKVLIYEKAPEEPQSEQSGYNKIEVPKGAEYRLVLSDGTRIWLNSDTRLSYPTNFEKNVREVEIHGEAYFEVCPENTSVEAISPGVKIYGMPSLNVTWTFPSTKVVRT